MIGRKLIVSIYVLHGIKESLHQALSFVNLQRNTMLGEHVRPVRMATVDR